MSVSLALLGVGTGTNRGPVVVTPDRLLTFSSSLTGAVSTSSSGAIGVGGAVGSTSPGLAAPRYRFRINPDRLNIKHEKIERYVLTKFGYERQYWGNGLSTFSYSGTSGVFRPNVTAAQFSLAFPNGFDIRQTEAYLRFKEFESFYRNTGSQNIFMYYPEYSHEWEGSLSAFSFERSATKPFHLDYQFTFTGLPFFYPDVTVNTGVDPTSNPAIQAQLASTSPASGSIGSNPSPSTNVDPATGQVISSGGSGA